jgi:IMP dehydrogenase/GMP reductase
MRALNDKIFSINDLSAPRLTVDDVLLAPTIGYLSSRSQAKIEIPFIYSSPMDTVTGFNLCAAMLPEKQNPVLCRFLPLPEKKKALSAFYNDENFWYSVGLNKEDYDFLNLFFSSKSGNSKVNISVDIAHGATEQALKFYKLYKEAPWCRNLMSGTVATPEAALFLSDYCTHIRIGIGPGSACSTRVVTGCGYPNLSAVYEISNAFKNKDNILIADGGIRSSGDIIKYLAAGANAVMLGRMLSSVNESHGWEEPLFGKPYKLYRGQASKEFQVQRRGKINGTPEGVQSNKKIYKSGSFADFNNQTKSAVASAISYLGINCIQELNPENVKFVRITTSGLQESHPHILLK